MNRVGCASALMNAQGVPGTEKPLAASGLAAVSELLVKPGPLNANAPVEDHVLKTAAQFFGRELMPILGISGDNFQIAPTEQVYLEMKDFYEDFNYLTEDGTWRHIEFESDGITAEDLRRFRAYESICSYYYKVEVVTIVVCSAEAEMLKDELKQGLNTYRVQIVRLKDWNADETIAQKCSRKEQGGYAAHGVHVVCVRHEVFEPTGA